MRATSMSAILFVFALGMTSVESHQPNTTVEPLLRWSTNVSNQVLALPDYRVGSVEPLRAEVVLTNDSAHPIRIDETRISCGCVKVSGIPKVIDGSASENVKVTVNAASEPYSPARPESVKMVTVHYRVAENPRQFRLRLKIKWNSRHPLTTKPPTIAVGPLKGGEAFEEFIDMSEANLIYEKEQEPVEIVEIGTEYGFVMAEIRGMTVRLHGTLPDDFRPLRRGTVTVHAKRGAASLSPLRIPISFQTVAPDYFVSPTHIPLFNRPDDQGKPVTIRVLSRRRPVAIASIEILNGEEQSVGELDFDVTKSRANGNSVRLRTSIPPMDSDFGWIQIRLKDFAGAPLKVKVLNAYR